MTERSILFAGAAARYLPHDGPARLVREVLEANPDSMECVVRFPAENALVIDGEVATHLLVEPAAQAAATHLAILTVEDGLEDGVEFTGFQGYLTGAKAVVVTRPTVPAETDIRIRVHPRGRRKPNGGLFKCTFEATLDGVTIASGELSSYVQPIAP